MNLHQHRPLLLVEDNPAHAVLVRHGLDGQPVTLYHTSDGKAALDYLLHRGIYAHAGESPRPHLVLLDLRLPKISGLDVLRTIKATAELRSIPVVIFTTSEAVQDREQAYALGADGYVVKPFGFEALSEALEMICGYWLRWHCAAGPRAYQRSSTQKEPAPLRNHGCAKKPRLCHHHWRSEIARPKAGADRLGPET